MQHWLEANRQNLTDFFQNAGQPKFRAAQFWKWLHTQRVPSLTAMTNIPAALRQELTREGIVRSLREIEYVTAADGLTGKWLYAPETPPEPENQFESVLIVEKKLSRRTVCVSCMVGCPLDCVFCATGKLGFTRNLSTGEIIEQVYRLDRHSQENFGLGVSHVVFMGMGEPLLNFDAVLRAADTFADSEGMGLSGRHITISTAGIPEGIERLARSGRNYRLAVSLHAPNQKLRERIMPVAKKWPLDELMGAVREFAEGSSRAVTFEYCLIRDFNDGPDQARELAGLVRGVGGKVNLIPWNAVSGVDLFPSGGMAVRKFQETLEGLGVSAPLRAEKGSEIAAACGQLRAERLRRGNYSGLNRY